MEVEFPYSFYFVWAHRNPNNNFYDKLYDITNDEDGIKIWDWLKENVIDENWREVSHNNNNGLIETQIYFKLKDDAIRFRLVWNAKIK